MNKSLLILTLAAFALTGAGTQASAQTAPEDVQAVDLGLPSGIRWASCNVGATTPEGYGYYFAWGETESKKDYSWTTYKYANVGERYHYKFTKYCTDASSGDNGFIDNKTVLEPEDDAATANWGDVWRMPTDAEWTELREQCMWTYTTLNGVYGYQVASKTNGNSIFLPVAGFRNGTSLYLQGTRGYYSSSSLLENYSDNVWIVTFNHEEVYRHSNNRNNGLSVRPVQDKQEEVVEPAYTPKPFTVAEGKQVTFSGGNLQYTRSTQTWAFAEHQYDMLGTDNVDGGGKVYDATYGYDKTGNALADKIDLFGWSGSTGSAKWGIGTSTDNSDYSGDFVDWGTNIGDGSTWYTLTADEWDYLLDERSDANQLVGVARIQLGEKIYTNGLVLLPDDWTCPAGVTFKSGFSNTHSVQAYADYQTFTLADWQQLEAAGAVFLPASGFRDGSFVSYVQSSGYYWSATPDGSDKAYYMFFISDSYVSYNYSRNRNYGLAVRLVKDYSNVSTDAATPSAANTAIVRKVLRNGQILIRSPRQNTEPVNSSTHSTTYKRIKQSTN